MYKRKKSSALSCAAGSSAVAATDGALIEQALAGNADAFDMLVQRYETALLNFARSYLRDYNQAYDVSQHVFLKLYLSLPSIHTYMRGMQKTGSLKPWLFQIAYNRCIDEMRKKRYALFSECEPAERMSKQNEDIPYIEMIQDGDPLPEEVAEQNDLQHAILRAIQLLPYKFRTIVFLRYTRQMTFVEIGQMLHMPASTAKTYFQRARPLLCAALNPYVQVATP